MNLYQIRMFNGDEAMLLNTNAPEEIIKKEWNIIHDHMINGDVDDEEDPLETFVEALINNHGCKAERVYVDDIYPSYNED